MVVMWLIVGNVSNSTSFFHMSIGKVRGPENIHDSSTNH